MAVLIFLIDDWKKLLSTDKHYAENRFFIVGCNLFIDY